MVIKSEVPTEVANLLRLEIDALSMHGLHWHVFRDRVTLFGPVDSATLHTLNSDGLRPIALQNPSKDADFRGAVKRSAAGPQSGGIKQAPTQQKWTADVWDKQQRDWNKKVHDLAAEICRDGE